MSPKPASSRKRRYRHRWRRRPPVKGVKRRFQFVIVCVCGRAHKPDDAWVRWENRDERAVGQCAVCGEPWTRLWPPQDPPTDPGR